MGLTPQENARAVCIAPKGKVRIVHRDPMDHWCEPESDHDSLDAATRRLDGMPLPQAACMELYDDQGARLPYNLH